jgi:hypothetical protein
MNADKKEERIALGGVWPDGHERQASGEGLLPKTLGSPPRRQ